MIIYYFYGLIAILAS